MKYVSLLITAISFYFMSISAFANTQQVKSMQLQENLGKLEKSFDGKIGVYAINTNNNQIIAYRADERFPVQSTIKLIGVAALLKRNNSDKTLLQEKIHYTKNDLMIWHWHPITGKYVANGMTLEALSEAAMSYSDNPAMNLIMKKLGGPKAITDFAHSIGNNTFNIEHYEGNLNSNPKDTQDTSTPKDMAMSLQKLTLGNILTQSQRKLLVTWMRNNTTGYKRIRAGVPIGWVVADKTGSGDYGVTNDIGILWSPICKPIILAIYTIRNKRDAKNREDIVASTTSIVLDEFAKNSPCFKALFS
ncbi:MAG: class A beta-lactamase [Gammaproteobacteria bacterium]|nr:class A beta-lactamase [Gammaproteobacteria bacterium]